MTTCPHAASGCNYPEGECAGVCWDYPTVRAFPRTTQEAFERAQWLEHQPKPRRLPWWAIAGFIAGVTGLAFVAARVFL